MEKKKKKEKDQRKNREKREKAKNWKLKKKIRKTSKKRKKKNYQNHWLFSLLFFSVFVLLFCFNTSPRHFDISILQNPLIWSIIKLSPRSCLREEWIAVTWFSNNLRIMFESLIVLILGRSVCLTQVLNSRSKIW